MNQDIEKRIIEIVARQMGFEESILNKKSRFIQDLNIDSLDAVELTMEIEDEFNLSIPDEDADKILTIGDAINYVKKAFKKGSPLAAHGWTAVYAQPTADHFDHDISGDVTQGLLLNVQHLVVGTKIYHVIFHPCDRRLEIVERPDVLVYGMDLPQLLEKAKAALS